MLRVVTLLVIGALMTGCIGFRFGPGFSASDTAYFDAPPKIVRGDSGYVLAWTYGRDAFPFVPRYQVRGDRVIFSVQGMSSAWPVGGRYSEMKIEGQEAHAAIERGEAYWWQSDGSLLRLQIVSHESPNKALEPTRGAVMPRADARVTPAPRVAHL